MAMAIGATRHLRTIAPILHRRFRAWIGTRTGKHTATNMADITPHDQGLAMCRMAADPVDPSGAPPVLPQDHGTAVAALPPEYSRSKGRPKIPPQFRRTAVDYRTVEPSGTIIIDTPSRNLYLTLGNGKAIRYGVGVGREGFTWSGTERISRTKERPDWVRQGDDRAPA